MYYLNLQVPHGIQKASKIDIPVTEAEIDQGTHRDGCTGCDQCKSTSKFESSTPFWLGTLDYMQIKGRYTKGQIFEEDNCWRDVSFLLYSFLFYFLRVLIRSWSCLTCLSFFVSRNLCAFWSKMCSSEALRPRIWLCQAHDCRSRTRRTSKPLFTRQKWICPLEKDHLKGNLIFQPSIFLRLVSLFSWLYSSLPSGKLILRREINGWKMGNFLFGDGPIFMGKTLSFQCNSFTTHSDTVDGQNPAPPRMMIIPLFIGF